MGLHGGSGGVFEVGYCLGEGGHCFNRSMIRWVFLSLLGEDKVVECGREEQGFLQIV